MGAAQSPEPADAARHPFAQTNFPEVYEQALVDWRQGEAGALPLREGEAFDVVLCQQGFQFFPDRAADARQVHGALAEGGRLPWRSSA